MIPATFRRGKIYNNQVSTPRPCQAAAKHLGCPSARVAMDALTLVGDGVEVVGRVGISEPSHTPRECSEVIRDACFSGGCNGKRLRLRILVPDIF
jgi:hypothetical protein